MNDPSYPVLVNDSSNSPTSSSSVLLAFYKSRETKTSSSSSSDYRKLSAIFVYRMAEEKFWYEGESNYSLADLWLANVVLPL